MPGLAREQIEAVDRHGYVGDVLAMPQHLEDALWRVESASLERVLGASDDLGPLLVCGMGGSAIGGDLAGAVLGERLLRPLKTVRGYELPLWASPTSVVLCASYSGNTEETLACYEAAGALGALRIVVTTGGRLAEAARHDGVPVIPLPAGLQPRAAVAYMLVAVLEVAALSRIALHVKTEIDAAASSLVDLAAAWGPGADTDSLAKRIAQRVNKTCVCVYGAGPTAPIARRWKTQINENAKWPAWVGLFPEVDHNEIVSWTSLSELSQAHVGIVALRDESEPSALAARFDLTARLTSQDVPWVGEVWSQGVSGLERMMSLCAMGDLVSIEIARAAGVDPVPVETIEKLKGLLAEESG